MTCRTMLVPILGLAVVFSTAPCLAQSEDARAHFSSAVSLYRSGKLDRALEEFTAARKAAPNDPLILNWTGFVLLRMERYSDAIEPLQ